jgi:hypothetical protein
MPFQGSVALQQGFGVVGELFTDSPYRAQSFTLVSASAAYNVFGRCFTITSEGVAQAGSGGTLGFAGFLVDPKDQALEGTVAGGSLAPSLVLPNQAQGELLTMGDIIVALPAAAAIGDLVVYDNTTGDLTTIAPGADLPVGKTFANAVVSYRTVTAAGLAVITVSPALVIPQPA